MKDVAHLTAGTAIAALSPAAVQAATEGNPLAFLAVGMAALLPDALDRQLAPALCRYDVDIVPDPIAPDMELVACAVAAAVGQAQARRRPVALRLHAIAEGVDRWRQYALRFNADEATVAVHLGPIVGPDGEPCGKRERQSPIAAADLPGRVQWLGASARVIDGPDAAVYRFVPRADGSTLVDDSPPRFAWSHSLVAPLLLALVVALVAGPAIGALAGLAYAAHLLIDLATGDNIALLHPLSDRLFGDRQRLAGERGGRTATIAWIGALVVLWNLHGNGVPARFDLAFHDLAFYGVGLPLGLLAAAMAVRQARASSG